MKIISVLFLLSMASRLSAQQVVKDLVVGVGVSCALFDDGRLKCWGANNNGQVGVGHTYPVGGWDDDMGPNLRYTDLGSEKVSAISGRGSFTCALFESGRVKCWGANTFGNSANGNFEQFLGDDPDDMGERLKFALLGNNVKMKSIAVGGLSACALSDDNRVKCWGYNDDGRLGVGDLVTRKKVTELGDSLPWLNLGTESKPSKIFAGNGHSCALFENAKVKCWGVNAFGELGFGNGSVGSSPSDMGDALPFLDFGENAPKVRDLQLGSNISCAIFEDESFKCWGRNAETAALGYPHKNNVGTGTYPLKNQPFLHPFPQGISLKGLSIGGTWACAYGQFGLAKCWGTSTDGNLGVPSVAIFGGDAVSNAETAPYLDFGVNLEIQKIASSNKITCALFEDSSIRCWGNGESGDLGTGDLLSRGFKEGTMGSFLKPVKLF